MKRDPSIDALADKLLSTASQPEAAMSSHIKKIFNECVPKALLANINTTAQMMPLAKKFPLFSAEVF